MAIIRIEVDEDTRKQLELIALKKGTSLKDLLPDIVKEYSVKNAVKGMEGASG